MTKTCGNCNSNDKKNIGLSGSGSISGWCKHHDKSVEGIKYTVKSFGCDHWTAKESVLHPPTSHVHLADGRILKILQKCTTNSECRKVIVQGDFFTMNINVYPCPKGHPNCFHEDLRKADKNVMVISPNPNSCYDGHLYAITYGKGKGAYDRRNRKPKVAHYTRLIGSKKRNEHGATFAESPGTRKAQRRVKDLPPVHPNLSLLVTNIDNFYRVDYNKDSGMITLYENLRTATDDRRVSDSQHIRSAQE